MGDETLAGEVGHSKKANLLTVQLNLSCKHDRALAFAQGVETKTGCIEIWQHQTQGLQKGLFVVEVSVLRASRIAVDNDAIGRFEANLLNHHPNLVRIVCSHTPVLKLDAMQNG